MHRSKQTWNRLCVTTTIRNRRMDVSAARILLPYTNSRGGSRNFRREFPLVVDPTTCCFALENAWFSSADHKIIFVLSKERNGSRSCTTVSVLEDNWLTKPQNDRRSVRLAGVGNWYCLCDCWVYVVLLWQQLEPSKCDPWLEEIHRIRISPCSIAWHVSDGSQHPCHIWQYHQPSIWTPSVL